MATYRLPHRRRALLTSCLLAVLTTMVYSGLLVVGGQVPRAAGSAPPPLASDLEKTITSAGDGTRVIFYGGNVYNIHHHNGPPLGLGMFACHDKVTGALCPGWSGNGSYFSPTSGAAIDTGPNLYYTGVYPGEYLDTGTGNLFFPAGITATSGYTNTVGVGCVNLATNTSCGFVPLASNAASPELSWPPTADITGAARAGTELYYATSQGDLLCFDASTRSECPGQPFTVDSSLVGNPDPGGTVPAMSTESAGDYVYTVHSREWLSATSTFDVSCFRASTKQVCPFYPVHDQHFAFASYSRFIVPVLDASGSPIGACWASNYQANHVGWLCLNNTASTMSVPPWQAPYPAGNTVGFTFGSPLIRDTKTYLHNNEVRNHTWAATYTCFDFAANAPCAGFIPSSSGVLMSSYTIVPDPASPNCLWAVGDAGRMETFDATTGKLGC